LISRSGAGACTTASSHARQPYRCVTITRNWARDHVEPLSHVLADHMHGRAAARAIGVFGRNHHMNARQMGGKRATIGAALLGTLARPHWVMLVVGGFGYRNGLLDILKRQLQLVLIELLRPAARLHALQLMQHVLQAVILRQRLVPLGNRRIILRTRHNNEACRAATSVGS
jgi:hypothetical protein